MAIVLYNISDLRQESAFVEICKDIGCHTRKLTNRNLTEKFGRLAGVAYKVPVTAAPDPAAGEKIPVIYSMPECILFAEFSDELLDEFLDSYKRAGLKPIEHKAVLTPHNCGWTLYGVLKEIGREAEAMGKNQA